MDLNKVIVLITRIYAQKKREVFFNVNAKKEKKAKYMQLNDTRISARK